MENMSLGLTLMLVGMVTVFAILLIVIYLSKLLIRLVNRYAPAEEVRRAPSGSGQVDATVQKVLAAVVCRLTGGKGTVESMEKM